MTVILASVLSLSRSISVTFVRPWRNPAQRPHNHKTLGQLQVIHQSGKSFSFSYFNTLLRNIAVVIKSWVSVMYNHKKIKWQKRHKKLQYIILEQDTHTDYWSIFTCSLWNSLKVEVSKSAPSFSISSVKTVTVHTFLRECHMGLKVLYTSRPSLLILKYGHLTTTRHKQPLKYHHTATTHSCTRASTLHPDPHHRPKTI